MFSRIISLCVCISSLFLFLSKYNFIVWLHHVLVIHSSVDGIGLVFGYWWTALLWVCAYQLSCERLFSLLLCVPRRGIAGYIVALCWLFGDCWTLFQSGCTIFHSCQHVWWFSLPHITPPVNRPFVAVLAGREAAPRYSFPLRLPDDWWCGTSFPVHGPFVSLWRNIYFNHF